MDKSDKITDNNEDRLKTFLKVNDDDNNTHQYYQINDNKQIFTLFDSSTKTESSTSKTNFEIDEIFTEKNEFSYIYEEIARDCINECLTGTHFTFLSYGGSASEKNVILFGDKDCYLNLNSRGIFPRLLERLIERISSNKNLVDNFVLNLSYICINWNKLIDLSKFVGKDLTNINQSDFIKAGIDIKGNIDLLPRMMKNQIDKVNDVLFFLTQLFDMLYKLDIDTMHLLSWSHFAFIIYINDNSGKLISTLSFVILSGSEQLISKNINYKEDKQNIQQTKNNIELKFTFENIVNSLDENFVPQEDSQSKLLSVLQNVSFNNKVKHKYRVIGCIVPHIGMYDSVKDTLMFLFDCKRKVRIQSPIKDESSKDQSNDIKKDEIIADLRSKLRVQQNTIKELTDNVDYKHLKIELLKENYKEQVNVLKKEFNFVGDINALLSGDKTSKEAKYTMKVREAVDNCKLMNLRIAELEQKIKDLQEEIRQIQRKEDIKKTDKTMVAIYTKIKEDKLREEEELATMNNYYQQIEKLNKENNVLQKLNNEYLKEIANKDRLLKNLPTILKESKESEGKLENLKVQEKEKVKKVFKREIDTIQNLNVRENNLIVEKYENLKEQKDKEIVLVKKQYKEFKKSYNKDINLYIEELVHMAETCENLISAYKTYFNPKKIGSHLSPSAKFNIILYLKREFEKQLSSIENGINQGQYPMLFKYLNSKGSNRIKTKIFAVNSNRETKKEDNAPESQKKKKKPEIELEEVERKNNQIFEKIKSDDEIDDLSNEGLIIYIKSVHKLLNNVEDFAENYIKYLKGYTVKEFKYNEKHVNDLINKNEKLKRQIEEQVMVNNRNKAVICSNEKMVERISSEHVILKSIVNSRLMNKKISFPYCTEIQNSSGVSPFSKGATYSKGFFSPNLTNQKKEMSSSYRKTSQSNSKPPKTMIQLK